MATSSTTRRTHKKTARKSARARKQPAYIQSLEELRGKKVAIVCDWLTGTGGAERVVLELHKLFPDAPIYTSQYDKNPRIWYGGTWFKDADVRTTWLQHLPKKLKKFLPVLRAYSFSRLDMSEFDVVLISSGAEAKAVRTRPDATVVWYCHAPTHYYWSRYDEYMRQPGFGLFNPLARLGLWLLVRPLRRWDYQAAQKPTHILANSTHIQRAIKTYYQRDSTIVFPPVDTARFRPSDVRRGRAGRAPEDRFGFVIAGRQTPYKRIDLAVEACSQLDLPLTVIGNGPDHTKLTAMAGQSVRFLTGISDEEISRHFQRANAFIFPGLDDFGIVAVEALSAGTPVIAYKGGGALDYIKEGKTGSFFEEQTAASLRVALRTFKPTDYDNAAVFKAAQTYSPAKFSASLSKFLAKATQPPKPARKARKKSAKK